jgi:hypothetical protein
MSLAFPAIHIFRLAALLCLSASVLICRSWLDFVFAAFRADLGEVLFHVHEIFPLFHRRLTCREFPRFVDFPQLEHSAQNSPLIPSSQAVPPHLHRRQLAAVPFCLGAEGIINFTSNFLEAASAKDKINRLLDGHAFRELGMLGGKSCVSINERAPIAR